MKENKIPEELQKILGKTVFSLSDIQANIKKIAESTKSKDERISKFVNAYMPFYNALGKGQLKQREYESLSTVFSSASYDKYFSLCLSAMGYYLVSFMNSNPVFQEILNEASRTLDVEQVYIYFSSSSLDVKKKLFSNSKYKFRH